jgi:hypothetical protein
MMKHTKAKILAMCEIEPSLAREKGALALIGWRIVWCLGDTVVVKTLRRQEGYKYACGGRRDT